MPPPILEIRESPFRPPRRIELETGQSLYAALRRHMPAGFDRPTRILIDGRELEPDSDGLFAEADLERPLEPGARAEINQLPGGPAILPALATWLIVTAITMAASYLLNALLASKPKGPVPPPDESPVYSGAGLANRARPGEPVAEGFGEFIGVPDYSSVPYLEYENNDQFFTALVTLGVGDYEISSYLIDDSPIDQFASPNPVEAEVFAPAAHGQEFGVIEAATGRYENVSTSVEVADQELLFNTDNLVEASMRIVEPNRIIITGPETWPDGYVPDATFILSGAGVVNDGTYTVQVVLDGRKELRIVEGGLTELADGELGSVEAASLLPWNDGGVFGLSLNLNSTSTPSFLVFGATVTLQYPGGAPEITGIVDGVFGGGEGGLIVLTMNTATLPDIGGAGTYTFFSGTGENTAILQAQLSADAGVIGPFVACLVGQAARRIDVDIIFPNGLFRTNKRGVTGQNSATFEWTIQQIDDDGNDIGGPSVQSEIVTGGQRSPLRRTYGWPVAEGRYKVSARRASAIVDQYDLSVAIWAGLKAVLTHPEGTPVYGETTQIMVRIRATNGIAAAGQRRFRVLASRKLPRRAGTLAAAATKNPADAWWYIAGLTGGQRDADTISESWDRWDNLTAAFNGVFDTRQTFGQALNAILAPVLSANATLGGLLSLVREEIQPLRAAIFTKQNIAPGRLELVYDFDDVGSPDGIEVEYRDAATFQQRYATVPAEAVEPEKVVGFGITDDGVAEAYTDLLWRRRLYQRRGAGWTTSPEGHIAMLGARVGVRHPMLDGGDTGLILAATQDSDGWELIVDRRLSWPAGESVFLILRSLDGSVSAPVEVTRGAPPSDDTDSILLAALPVGIELSLAGTPQPTIFAFGPEAVLDFLITDAEDLGEDGVALKGVIYDERVYERLDEIIGPEPS